MTTTTDTRTAAIAEANEQMETARQRYEAAVAAISARLALALAQADDAAPTLARVDAEDLLIQEYLDGPYKHICHFANSVAKREEIAECVNAHLWHADSDNDNPAQSCAARRRQIASEVLEVFEDAGFTTGR